MAGWISVNVELIDSSNIEGTNTLVMDRLG